MSQNKERRPTTDGNNHFLKTRAYSPISSAAFSFDDDPIKHFHDQRVEQEER
ncbi:hypothetical protein JXA12_00335 [Candidatus Woesearchaeota archaeon]|nr:hypothetical protein [Candidatus Woesearchaeota archaeon]